MSIEQYPIKGLYGRTSGKEFVVKLLEKIMIPKAV